MAGAPYHRRVIDFARQMAMVGAGLGLIVCAATAGLGSTSAGIAAMGSQTILPLLTYAGIGALIGGAAGTVLGSVSNAPLFNRDGSDRQALADRQVLHQLVSQSVAYAPPAPSTVRVAGESPASTVGRFTEAERTRQDNPERIQR